MKMLDLPTPPPDTELSDSASRALETLLQRSPEDIALLELIYTKVMNTLEYKMSFFLPIPASQYDPVSKTPTTILQDTGVLLTMPEESAQLVLCMIEGLTHKLSREDMSDEQWKKVETLTARLAVQHPDHVTNVTRLWEETIDIAGEKRKGLILKDLGLLFQHRDDEVVVMLDRLGVSAELFQVEDEDILVIQDEDEDDWETEAE
jgi:hypothetical protein